MYLLCDAPFKRGPAHQEAFKALKATLKEALILVYPDFKKEFILYTDARNFSFGAILAQLDEYGQDHPVAYALCVMNKHERDYTVTEKNV